MSITVSETAFVGGGNKSISLSSFIDIVPSNSNPQYIVVTAVDHEAYTKGASGATGTFTGNGHTDTMTVVSASAGIDSMGIVFSYNATTGQYTNATYGNLSQVTYNASSSLNDMTQIAVYATNNVSDTGYASNFVAMQSLYGTTDYVGSATVATQPTFAGTVPANATPTSIENAALSFVGKVWNNEGCWVLASTIAAEAGAGLPASTCFSGTPVANGEWFVAFNGASQVAPAGGWQSLVKAGEIITIPGHITTVVSGSGSTAMLVDNATNSTNSAKDGSANDIIIQKPFSASQEFNNVAASGIVIYELDAPIVSAAALTGKVTSAVLSSLFSVVDPNNTAIKAIQVYDAATGTTINGKSADGVANAITLTSLSGVTFSDGSGAADTIEVRAENALGYWGDWTVESVNGGTVSTSTTTTTPKAPTGVAIAAQTWKQGQTISFTVPTGTFTDPQHEALTYKATESNGSALPTWLKFNSSTDSFTGTAAASGDFTVTITATDTSGLFTSESFLVNMIDAPTAIAIPAQTWTQGQVVAFNLPTGSFTDPQGESLTYSAKLSNGAALPSWLHVNSTTGELTGTVPSGVANMTIIETATDTSGLSAFETFSVTGIKSPVVAKHEANQSVLQGQAVSLTLSGEFTDPQHQTLTYVATESNGSTLPAWLKFNTATDAFTGTAPAGASNFGVIVTATDTSELTASDSFQFTVIGTPTVVQTNPQTMTVGVASNFALPAHTFTDPQGEALTYSATLANGSALPSWLKFNATTESFSGTAPSSVGSSVSVEVTARDGSGLTAHDAFTINLVGVSNHVGV